MTNVSFQENLISNVIMLETISRIFMSALFGFSVLSFGCTLTLKARSNNHSKKLHNFSRFLFVLATFSTIIYGTLEFILPINSITSLVYTAICIVLSISVILFDQGNEGMPAFSFLVGALIFLMVTITPFLDPKPLYFSSASVDWFVYLHIGTAVLGEAIFVAVFCASLIYLRDYRKLKQRKLDSIAPATSLSALEKLVERTSLVGLASITISLFSGIALIFFGRFSFQVGFVKILWAFLVWGWYVMSIFGRNLWGWSGKKGAKLSIFGMLLLLLGLFGTIWQYF